MMQFLNQYGWYLLIFGFMFFMHRRGAGGCCGGHQHGKQDHDRHETKHPISSEQKR